MDSGLCWWVVVPSGFIITAIKRLESAKLAFIATDASSVAIAVQR